MDINRLKRFATEARNILIQGVAHRLQAIGFDANGTPIEEPQLFSGGATIMGDTVSTDFYEKWQSLARAIHQRSMKEVAEEAAYTWFNRLMAIRIMVKNNLIPPVLQYESEGVFVPLLVTEARQGRLPVLQEDERRKLMALLDDDSKTAEQFAILIVAFCHTTPVINACFGSIKDYTELLLPTNILAEGGFVDLINHTDFIAEEDYKSPELIGWLYQFYISEKKDDVFASFKKGKKAEAEDIPAATQIFTPNWIVKYMVQNTIGRIYLDNNPYEEEIQKSWKYLVEPTEKTPDDKILRYDDLKELKFADLACGSGHILNEGFDILYDLYILEGYSRSQAIENIFRYNLTGIDIDTRAKQLAQFALLLKACQKDASFADAHIMPRIMDMPKPYDPEQVRCNLDSACLKFVGGYENVVAEDLQACFELMNDADSLGSIMRLEMDEDFLAMVKYYYEDWTNGGIDDCPEEIKVLLPGVEFILALNEKYSAVVMNPPYMGSGNMNKVLSDYVKEEYPEGKADLMTVFMMVADERTLEKGKYAMINLPSWLFLSTFEDVRLHVIKNHHIDSLLHMGRGIFGIDWGSVAFAISKYSIDSQGCYFRLHKRNFQHIYYHDIEQIFLNSKCDHSFKFNFDEYRDEFAVNNINISNNKGQKIYYEKSQIEFLSIPGSPIGYWISQPIIDAFKGERINSIGISDGQNITGDNQKYMRLFWEVNRKQSGKKKKWVPMAKGGDYRKWYGNIIDVVDWSEDAQMEYKRNPAARIQNDYLWYRKGITWNLVSSTGTGFRYLPETVLFNKAAPTIVFKYECLDKLYYTIGYLNTKIVKSILTLMNPTINTNIAEVFELPIIIEKQEEIDIIAESSITISRQDWDSHETSWDFEANTIVAMCNQYKEDGCGANSYRLENFVKDFESDWREKFDQLHTNEEELNRQFIEIYGLQEELTPDVPKDEITILQQGEISIENNDLKWHRDVLMKQLISYAVGCMMGRYSIDKPGLILANQGDGIEQYNVLVPNSCFEVDDDGIVPLMSAQSDFADNATVRFKNWLTVTFGEGMLVDNLNFIEKALGKSIDDYFVKDFWKDHKKMYQNRPIYWLFSSKKGAFQCLAYMHRMDAYTAERIRTKYLLPHIEWLMQKQGELEANAANLTNIERKQLDSIIKQIAECREYHDRLHVVADQQIAFDLDDGVVVNYAKFGDVLAKIK